MENVAQRKTDFTSIYNTVITLLEKHLPAHLTYHNAAHAKAKVEVTRMLAEAEGVDEEDKIMLLTAALYHDTGFLRSYKNHEEGSCNIAREMLPKYGYTKEEIEGICHIILSTKIPLKPTDKLQQIMCDADLHYIGTDQYLPVSEKLFSEFKKEGLVSNRTEWQQKQILFLGSHKFFTGTAQQLYGAKKAAHLNKLIASEYKFHHRFNFVQDGLLMVAGILLAAFALKGFLVPNKFFDGGVTGISLLVHEFTHLSLALVIVGLNLPFVVASFFTVNKSFAYKTFAAVVLLGLALLVVNPAPVTSDKLLISIFGGVFLGLGVGLTMRSGCALDGIEVLALYTLKRTSFTITEIILGINLIIFAVAAFKFGLPTALYSALTYFAASRMIDYVIEGIQAYTGVTIISGESEVIKHRLVNELGRGITVYKGERGFLPGNFDVSSNCDIIFTLVTRMELRKLKNLVYETDPKAFVFANTIREASGGIIKRREAH